jgi:hypothetical protein
MPYNAMRRAFLYAPEIRGGPWHRLYAHYIDQVRHRGWRVHVKCAWAERMATRRHGRRPGGPLGGRP